MDTECVGPESEMAGLAEKCQNCPAREQCLSNRNKVDPAIEKIKQNLHNVKHKILVLSGKGGVGKSMVASQLALSLANVQEEEDENEDESSAVQVGVLDVDLCGPSMPTIFQLEGKQVRSSSLGWTPVYFRDNLGIISIGFLLQDSKKAVIWRGPKKNGMIVQFLRDVYWGDEGLDYLVIDSPPGTSDEHLTVGRYLKHCDLDGAVIVTTPQDVSIIDVKKEIDFCKRMGIKIIGVIENMSGFACPKCHTTFDIFKATSGGGEQLAKDYGLNFLGKIPLDPNLMKACEEGSSFVNKYPNSVTSKSLNEIVENIKSYCSKKE